MGKQYSALTPDDIDFINDQPLFYIASASGQEVNLSPRGFECARIMDANTMLFLDYPGSGDRTARDIRDDGEVTVVFNAFKGAAKILRLFCKGELIEKDNKDFKASFTLFDEEETMVRRIVKLHIYAVESSCGMGVPKMQLQHQRNGLQKWIKSMHEKGSLQAYMDEHAIAPNLKDLDQERLV